MLSCVALLVGLAAAAEYSSAPPHNGQHCPVDDQLEYYFRADYADGVSSMDFSAVRPSCCAVQNATIERFVPDRRGLNQLTMSFGQFTWSHDNALTDEDATNAVLGEEDTCLGNFFRSKFVDGTNPRRHPNQVTACTDASIVYGSNEAASNALRSFEGGMLRVDDQRFPPLGCPDALHMANPKGKHPNELFCLGDVRGNENVLLTSFHVLFVRHHNTLAKELAEVYPDWDDEALFNKARALLIAMLQKISFYDYGSAILGGDDWYSAYAGHQADVEVKVFAEFSQAVFRFPHAQISNTVRYVDPYLNEKYGLEGFFFEPEWVANQGIGGFIMGMIMEPSNKVGLFQAEGMKAIQLFARDCARGRDFGLVSYKEARESLFGETITSFEEITMNRETRMALMAMYSSVDEIDLFVGGVAEDPVDGSSFGPLFRRLFADQLVRLRDGDPYWYENPEYTYLTEQEKQLVSTTTLARIILQNTRIECVPRDVFFTGAHVPLVCRDELLL